MRGLPSRTVIAAATAAAFALPACAQNAAGRIVQLRGDVSIESAAGRQPAAPGQLLQAATTIQVGAGGQAQLVMADGTLVALQAGSRVRWSPDAPTTLALAAGALRLDATSAREGWRVDLPGRSIRTNGYLKLAPCTEGCKLAPGLYGRVVQGEAVLEYQGGRSVLRNRAFRWPAAETRPEVLAAAPALLDDSGNLADAQRARTEASEQMKAALEAFRDNQDDLAAAQLEKVRALVPGEPLVSYYLGLIALRRQDNAKALALLQQYAREDPEGATLREVPKTLTLLSSSQLQQEVATAVAREKDIAATPPEPNSIAVQAFVNRGNDAYRALSKGIAAMIIADLGKVPGLKVLEREKVQLLLDEMKLGDSGLADPASAVRSGRLMRAEKVIVGNFEVSQ